MREAGFRPKLFVAVGNTATLGEHGPPALLLFGRYEEFGIPAQTTAPIVISPWSDHALEAFDPVLVNAAVKAACATVGRPVPAAPNAWRWRLAGLVLGMAGGFVLMFRLPELHPRLSQIRGFIVPAIPLMAIIYSLPLALQFPLFSLALTFWVLLLTYMTNTFAASHPATNRNEKLVSPAVARTIP